MSNIVQKTVDINRKKVNEMLINTLAEDIRKANQILEDNKKNYSPMGNKEKLQELKLYSVERTKAAIKEVENFNTEFDNKIKEIRNTPFTGHNMSKEYIDNVNFTKIRLLADIKINPYTKNEILEKAIASKIGAQAVLELIQNKDIDDSYWTDDLYKKAYINSKTQQELDWEIKKEQQIEVIGKEQNEAYNYGSYLGAIKLLNGDVNKKTPPLERQFDIEIAQIDRAIEEGN